MNVHVDVNVHVVNVMWRNVCMHVCMDGCMVWYGMGWAGQGWDGMRVGWDVDMYGMDVCTYVRMYVCM